MSRKHGIKGSEAIQLGKLIFLKSVMVGYNDIDYVLGRVHFVLYGRKFYYRNGREAWMKYLLRLKKRYGIDYENNAVSFACEINVNSQLYMAAIKVYEKLDKRYTDKRHYLGKRRKTHRFKAKRKSRSS